MIGQARWLIPLGVAAAVVVAAVAVTVLFRLAPAGPPASRPNQTTQVAATPATKPQEHTMDLLTPEALKLWWVEPGHGHYTVNADREMVIHSAEAQGAAFRGEVGGMSLDNYRVSLEFIVDDAGTTGDYPRTPGFRWNIQIAPRGTLVFCQVFPNACNICCWDPREAEPFRHVSDNPNSAYLPEQWNRMEVIAEASDCQLVLNGELQARARVPIGTAGMLGLVVNFASNAKVRIRNLHLTLVDPTPEQLKELRAPALENWRNWVAAEKAAGRPGKLSPVDDQTTTNRPTSGTEARPGE